MSRSSRERERVTRRDAKQAIRHCEYVSGFEKMEALGEEGLRSLSPEQLRAQFAACDQTMCGALATHERHEGGDVMPLCDKHYAKMYPDYANLAPNAEIIYQY